MPKPLYRLVALCCLFFTHAIAIAQTGSCLKGGFQQLIGGRGDENAFDVKESIGANGYIIAGSTNSSGAGGTDALLIRTDTNGTMLWAKTYGSSGNDAFSHIMLTRDGNYLATGICRFTSHVSDIFIAKIDPNGNLIWARSFGAGTPYGENGHMSVETDDGGFTIAADYNSTPTEVKATYIKTDANGNPLWIKVLNDGGGNSSQAYGVVAQGDRITGTGVVARGAGSTYNDGYLLKMNSSDGSLLWTKNVESESRSNRLEYIRLKNNRYLLDMYNTNDWVSGNIRPMIFATDTSGNLIYSQSYEIQGFQPDVPVSRGFSPTADGGYITTISEIWGNSSPRLAKINSTGNVDWTDNFITYSSQQMHMSLEDSHGNILAVGQGQGATSLGMDILFIKTNAAGELGDNSGGCQVTRPPAVHNPVNIQITDAPSDYWVSSDNGGITAFTPNVQVADYIPPVKFPCDGIEHCSALELTGMDTLCNRQDIVTYKAARSPGCTRKVNWSVDNPVATLISSTDSTVQLQFSAAGAVTLHGEINGNCGIVQADKKIVAFDSLPIQLGKDTAFCPGGNMVLDAGPGFQSYLWNTGEISRQITISSTGNYSVAAMSINHCISRDTLSLVVYDLWPNLGPDTFICRNSAYTFNPGNTFDQYLWQDGSTGQNFTATEPGEYWVRVEDSHHCTNADTAYILGIHELPANFLDASAIICSDDYLSVKAKGEWSAYLWSNNEHTDTTSFFAPGQYWLEVTDRYSCKARDTITVIDGNCRRDIYFPNAFSPNGDGHNDVFRPTVYGTLGSFHLVIFNRWGEQVFETNDASRGWNGVYHGSLQQNNGFVWYAVYQFRGRTQKQHKESGTLFLLK